MRYTGAMIKKIATVLGSILLSLAAGGIGSLATTPNIPTWYEPLDKPPLLPPNGVFGPVWTVLYILMGIALALVILKEVKKSKQAAYLWFGVHLVLNTLWSVVFFGLQQPWIAVIIIFVLIGAIIMTAIKFRQLVPVTLWMFAPYLAWVCFATYLNIGVAVLN